jgi:dynein heavy chain
MTPGSEPWPLFRDFSDERGFDKRRVGLSLGQDQGPRAVELVNEASREGKWVLLQNAHVYESWMPALERLLEDLLVREVHPDFRLWLTTMPTPAFPSLVLQYGVKVTQEPPRGLKASLRNAFAGQVDEQLWNSVSRNGPQWRRLLFSLSMFHGVIQERRKFGSLGWNIPYGWNQPDFASAIKSLATYVSSYAAVPWKALKFMVGVINYGGRVTDFLDLRCQQTLLDRFFDPAVAEPGRVHSFTDDGVYGVPESVEDLSSVHEYLAELPPYESPELFGLHANADITFNRNTSRYQLEVIQSVQPRQTGGGGGAPPVANNTTTTTTTGGDGSAAASTNGGGGSGGGAALASADDIVFALATEFLNRLPESIDRRKCHEDTYRVMEDGTITSLGTVVAQEIDVFNRINERTKRSVRQLQLAIGGQVVMSAQLEAVYQAFLLGRVPEAWHVGSYLSRKPLASWLDDTINRIEFLRDWNDNGAPSSFWLSGFFFPQGFLTGVLQTHSRQNGLSIDSISLRAHVLTHATPDAIPPGELPDSGVFVHGLFLEGARWNRDLQSLDESRPGELFTAMPVIWLQPVVAGLHSQQQAQALAQSQRVGGAAAASDIAASASASSAPPPQQQLPVAAPVASGVTSASYACPLYKTAARSGVLSTTGLSTNFVVSLDLPSGAGVEPSHWILRGVAMLCMLDD